jgi:hypothetical protein
MQSSRLRWLSLAALLAWSPSVGAQGGGDADSTEYDKVIAAARAAAREAYQLGQKEYQAGNYAAAHQHFESANQRMPTPRAMGGSPTPRATGSSCRRLTCSTSNLASRSKSASSRGRKTG